MFDFGIDYVKKYASVTAEESKEESSDESSMSDFSEDEAKDMELWPWPTSSRALPADIDKRFVISAFVWVLCLNELLHSLSATIIYFYRC